jgi:hypothetical protein
VSTYHPRDQPFRSVLASDNPSVAGEITVTNRIMWHVTACATTLLLFPMSGGAQVPATSFDELRQVLRAGNDVTVAGTDGRITKGKLVEVTASSLTVERYRWPWQKRVENNFGDTAVTTVKRMDSPWEGLLLGFAAGSIPTIIAGCHKNWRGEACALVGVVGAAIGGAIDVRHNKTVYRAGTPPAGRGTVSLSPSLSTKAAGATLSLRF